MRGGGFELPKALSHRILSPAHLTALLPPHKKLNNPLFKKICPIYYFKLIASFKNYKFLIKVSTSVDSEIEFRFYFAWSLDFGLNSSFFKQL